MHEWRLTRSIVKTVVDTARAEGAARVRVVTLSVGSLVAISPERVRAQFAIAATGSIADGATVKIRPSPDDCAEAKHAVRIESVEFDE